MTGAAVSQQKVNRLPISALQAARQICIMKRIESTELRIIMAFDGITVANIVKELSDLLTDGRVYKIAQTESDELLLTIKVPAEKGGQHRLYLSADASLPLVYMSDENKNSPMTAPGFCMLLRKHIQNGRIRSITQPGLERIIRISIEHLDEMGDLKAKTLLIELMGKYSNIIFTDENDVIIDSIKRIPASVSSVREVLPGRPYFIPETQNKLDPLHTDALAFSDALRSKSAPVYKAIYGSYTGLSSMISQEICYRAGVDSDLPTSVLENAQIASLYAAFDSCLQLVKDGAFTPCVVYENGKPKEYAAIPLTIYAREEGCSIKEYPDMSSLLEQYYAEKNTLTRIRQKSVDLRKIVSTALERTVRKYDLQLNQMKDTEKKDRYRIYGELLTVYGYNTPAQAKSITVNDYNSGNDVTIPLDPSLTPSQNAKKYFDRYSKLKRTYETLSELTVEVKNEIDHLESISTALDIAQQEEDLVQIKEELIASGYIHRKGGKSGKKVKVTSKPFHYLSSDGFDIYVGKNNYQNDELTFKTANGGDWWFHAKGMPGSHVVLITDGKEVPDRAFEEAASLAAFYSKAKNQDKVEIDYLQRKNVKKPNGSKPGFVVYYTNYSMVISPDISALQQLS